MTSDQRAPLSAWFRRRQTHFRFRFQSMVCVLCVFLLSGFVSGCDSTPSESSKNSSAPTTTKEESAPIAPLLPPGANDRPAGPGTGTGLSTLPGMQPAKGLNVDTLFAEDIRDPMDRIKRLENVVLDMRRDFNTVLPSIMRLVAVEQDMQNLIGQLQTLTEDTPAISTEPLPDGPESASLETQQDTDQIGATQHPPIVPTERKEDSQPPPDVPSSSSPHEPGEEDLTEKTLPENPAIKPTEEKMPEEKISDTASDSTAAFSSENASAPTKPLPSTPGIASILHGLRIGEHSGKTRIVIDLNKPTEFHADLDNEEKLLVVEIQNMTWTSEEKSKGPESTLIASYRTEPSSDSKGTLVIFSLRAPATLVKALSIPGHGTTPARIAIDMAAAP